MPEQDVLAAAAAAAEATTAAATPREDAPAGGGGDAGTAAAAAAAGGGAGKRVLAIDIDEVLGQFVLQLCGFHNESYGTSLTPEDFSSYYFHEVWGGTRSSADDKMRDFFRSRHFLDGIPVVDGALRVLRKHAANFELHIVTSRQDILQGHTREWVDANYPGVFVGLHFGNHFSEEGVQRSKPELCRSIRAALIIDDNMRYATQCAEAGIPAYLFGDYAWNRTSEPLPENVRRTVTWADVDAQLDSLLNQNSESSTGGGGGNNNSCCSSNDDLKGQGQQEAPAAASTAAAPEGEAAAPAVTALPGGGEDATASTMAAAPAMAVSTMAGSRDDGDVRPACDREVSQPVVPPSASPPLGEEVVACSA